jgi:hypothetical protein
VSLNHVSPLFSAGRIVAATTALLGAGGCAHSQFEADAMRVLTNRVFDVTDVVGVRVAVGPGLMARVQATEYVAIGAGSLGATLRWTSEKFDPHFFGWNGREGGTWIELREEAGISTFWFCESSGESLAGNVTRFGCDARRVSDIGGEVHLGVVGVAAEVRVIECFDLVAGMFGADPAGDDVASIEPDQPPNAARNSAAAAGPVSGR